MSKWNIIPAEQEHLKALSEGAPIFSSRAWMALYAGDLRCYDIMRNEQKVGSFQLYFGRKLGISYAISPAMCPHIGLRYSLGSEQASRRLSEAKQLHDALASFLAKLPVDILECCLPHPEQETRPYTWAELDVRPRHTYHLDLSLGESGLLEKMSPERRRNIKKSSEDGLKVIQDKDVKRCYGLILKSLKRQSADADLSVLRTLLESEELAENRNCYTALHDGTAIATALVVHDENMAYYLIGGYDEQSSHEGGISACLWAAIRDAIDRGQGYFDLEGSMVPSVERYYRGFGGELKTYFSLHRYSILGKAAKWWQSR